MTTLLETIDARIRQAMKARQAPTRDALRMLKVAIAEATSDSDARLRLERHRRKTVAFLMEFTAYGTRAEGQADGLVFEVSLMDELVPPLSEDETREVTQALCRSLGLSGGALVGAVLRAVPGRVDPARVAAVTRDIDEP